MCFTKTKVKTKQFKSLFPKLVEQRQTLLAQNSYSRFFLQHLLFMEETLKRDLSSTVSKICSCTNMPDSYVKEGFYEAFLSCSSAEKLQYFQLILKAAREPTDFSEIQKINRTFNIYIRCLVTSNIKEQAHLRGFKLSAKSFQIDLRRYIIRKSKSSFNNCFVLQAIYKTNPQKIRFFIEETEESEANAEVFLDAAKLSFMHVATTWSKNNSHVEVKQTKIIKKEKKIDFQSNQVQKDVWFEIIKQLGKNPNQPGLDALKTVQQYIFNEDEDQEKNDIKLKKAISDHQEMRKSIFFHSLQLSMNNQSSIKKNQISVRKPSQRTNSMIRNEKNIIKTMIPGYNLRNLQNIGDFSIYQKKEKAKTIIYRHHEFHQIKAKMIFQLVLPKIVVLGLIDFLRYKEWNEVIKNAQIKMKLESENCIISSLFVDKNESFQVLTHLCEYDNNYLIAIKKKDSKSQKFFSFAFIKICFVKGKTQLFFHVMYEDKEDFSINFIHSIADLESYLAIKKGKQEIKQYLKFGRKIDKQLKNQFFQEQRRSHEYSYSSKEFGNAEQICESQEELDVEQKQSFKTINMESENTFNN